MGKSTYVRKTDNPNMGWSDARKAEWSVQCKKRHADGNFYKKSRKIFWTRHNFLKRL